MADINEIWDRLWQVTRDVVDFAEGISASASGEIMQTEMVRSAMRVGSELVRAQAADDAVEFQEGLSRARMMAIETDYWLRLAYAMQQDDNVQQDLSSILSQYQAIVDGLNTFSKHSAQETQLGRIAKGPRVG